MKMTALVALMTACLGFSALAQSSTPDASLPDAAVGSGGADRASEEADQEQGKCQSGLDCPDRFTCSAGRCVPAPLQTASCGGFAAAGISLLGVGLVLRARRRG